MLSTKKFWISFLCIFLSPFIVFAGIEITELFPNTLDDAVLEYVDIHNTGCADVDLHGYVLSDVSGKAYRLSGLLTSHETRRIMRTESKIVLNNTDETIFLHDPDGNLVDQFSYTVSQKGVVIADISVTDDICEESVEWIEEEEDLPEEEEEYGDMVSGETLVSGEQNMLTNQDSPEDASEEDAGLDMDGDVEEEILVPDAEDIMTIPPVGEGSGVLYDPKLFPVIELSPQSPTNASLSGAVLDCKYQDVCRINITLEPIFTDSYRSKDFLCEVHTDGTVISDCNPGTIYPTSSGSLLVRLIYKPDPRMVSESVFSMVHVGNEEVSIENPNTSGVALSDILNSADAVVFPEIIPTFQSSTNTTFSGNIFTCTTLPCRINLNFESIFTGAFLPQNYTCLVLMGDVEYSTCNPPQMYPEGSGMISVKVIHKKTSQVQEATFFYETHLISKTPSVSEDVTPPVALIDFDGKLDDWYEEIGKYDFNCYQDICPVNLTAERSYDPDGSQLRFLWIFGQNTTSNRKNPGVQKLPLGEHTIILQVIDAAGNLDEIVYRVHVLGKVPVDKKPKTTNEKNLDEILASLMPSFDKKIDALEQKVLTKTDKEVEKQQKKVKPSSFVPPDVQMQGNNLKLVSGVYVCEVVRATTCSVNFALTGSVLKDFVYEWNYSDGTQVVGKNPKAKKFSLGKHEILLTVRYSEDAALVYEQRIPVQIIQRSPKKKVATKIKTTSVKKEKAPTEHREPEKAPQEDMAFSGAVFLASLAGGYGLFRRTKIF